MRTHPFLFHLRSVGLVVAVALAWGMGGCKPDETAATLTIALQPEPVQVKPVTRVSMNPIIAVSGTLVADKTAPLSFLVPGKVNRLYVDEGDHVSQGTLLATLESEDYRNRLDMAEAAFQRAKDAYDRYEPLYRQGAFAEKNLIELKTVLAEAAASRNIARKALRDTELVAPIPGIVGVKAIEIGQMVSAQSPALTIVKTDLIYARVAIPESEVGRITMGAPADVAIPAFDGRSFAGKVTMIGAVADPQTRTYPVKIALDNPDFLLRPGMIIQAGIRTASTRNTLSVPGSAIVRDADNLTYVFVANAAAGIAQRRRVTPGAAVHSEIEIKEGLSADDAVIVAGQHKLTDGAPIVISQSDAGGTHP